LARAGRKDDNTMAVNRSRNARLQVEQLEDRQLLATAVVLPSASELLLIPGIPVASRGEATGGPGTRSIVGRQGSLLHASQNRLQVSPRFRFAHPRGKPPRPHSQRVPPSSASVNLTPGQAVIFQQLNLHRQQAGLPPLTLNPLLMEAAQGHADNMARQDKYGDTDTDGHILDGHDVVYRVGLVGYRYSWLGENVAFNQYYPNPAQTLADQWWNSPPHRANMLETRYTEVGIGIATGASGRTYGVEDFGRPW
jgi:uncharacterized protein YkwD